MPTPLIGPDGREYELPDEKAANLPDILKLGYRVETPEAPRTLGEQVKGGLHAVGEVLETGVEGAVQGATAGLFGAALGRQKADYETPAQYEVRQLEQEGFKRRREEHPVASIAGEMAGMLVSPVQKVGAAIRGGLGATTALGRVGAAALSEGAEGMLYGAGNTLSEAALGNEDLTAEKMIAGIGLGGVLGMAGGGIGAGLGEGLKAVLPKLAGAKRGLEQFAEERWLKAGGAIQGDIKKIPEHLRPEVANIIRDVMSPTGKLLPGSLEDAAAAVAGEREAVAKQLMQSIGVGDAGGLLPKMARDEAQAALEKGFRQNGDRMGQLFEAADKAGAAPRFSPVRGRYDAFEAGLNPAEKDLIAGELAKVRKYLDEMGRAPVGSPKNSFGALNDLKSTLQADINWVADSGAKNGLKRQLVGILRDELDSQFELQMGSRMAQEFQEAKAAYGALKQAAKALKPQAATGADAINALVRNAELAQPSLAGRHAALEHAAKLIQHGVDRRLGNRFISPSDYAIGIGGGLAAAMSNPAAALAGLPAAIAHKVLREHGAGLVAKLADHIAGSPQLLATAQGFSARLQKASPWLGEYAAPLAQAIAHSPATGLATHMVWAQANPDYAEKAQAAGFLPETREEAEHAHAKASTLAATRDTLAAQNDAIEAAVARALRGGAAGAADALKGQDFGAKRMRRASLESYRQRVSEVRELAANPDALLERVSGNAAGVEGHLPAVVGAMTRASRRAVDFLAKEIQEPPPPGPLAAEWTPSNAEVHRFGQLLGIVEEPLSVLEHAAAGTLTEDHVRALKAVYPGLALELANKALEQLAAAESAKVPYASRFALHLLTGVDPDGSLSSAAVASNQRAGHAMAGPPKAAPQGKQSLAQRMALPQQQREMEA